MADERSVDDPVQQLGTLQRDFEDFRSTMVARLSRRPTGDIEPTIRDTAKASTLLMQGQLVNRADYPGLWQWAGDQALVRTGLFTVGNGTTTFGLPNFSGRYIVGGGTFETITYGAGDLVGDNFRALVTGNMPAHNHGGVGNHNPHPEFGIPVAAGSGATAWAGANLSLGAHTHSTQGNGDAFDNRPASVTVNWLIWT